MTAGVPVGQTAEFWSGWWAADELRARPCLGNGREGVRVPTHQMRQLDPGMCDCARFGLAFG